MSLRILIVDDSQLVRKAVRQGLERHAGWQVCGEGENGRQGIEKAEQLKPDVIILDLSMPVMNGIEAAHELKQRMPSVPIVMFTSFKTDHLVEQMLASGVTVAVEKPSLAGLVQSIESLLLEHAK